MAEDLVGKVAALEVYVKTHEDRLKKISDTIDDLYVKNDGREREVRDILIQLKGICSEFSEFSVKIKEFNDVPEAFRVHKAECENYRKNDGFFKFWKNNPIIAGELFLTGIALATLVSIVANPDGAAQVIRGILSIFGIKV